MYLVSQLWWCLLLAFLLGALVGYVLWRACGHRLMQSNYERQMKDLSSRLAAIEQERNRFSAAAVDGERENARLKEALKAAAPAGKPVPARETRT